MKNSDTRIVYEDVYVLCNEWGHVDGERERYVKNSDTRIVYEDVYVLCNAWGHVDGEREICVKNSDTRIVYEDVYVLCNEWGHVDGERERYEKLGHADRIRRRICRWTPRDDSARLSPRAAHFDATGWRRRISRCRRPRAMARAARRRGT